MATLTELAKAKRLFGKCQTPAGKQIAEMILNDLKRKIRRSEYFYRPKPKQ